MNFRKQDEFSPEAIAPRLQNNETCFIRLEPGDGTRYDFYLIPVTEQHVKYAYGLLGTHLWLYFGPINNSRDLVRNVETFVHLDTDPGCMLVEFANIYSNPWTHQLLAHYLAEVAEQFAV